MSEKKRGFAALSEEQRKEIAKKGGKAVSSNRLHMAEIGRKGGEAARKRASKPQTDENLN